MKGMWRCLASVHVTVTITVISAHATDIDFLLPALDWVIRCASSDHLRCILAGYSMRRRVMHVL